LVQNELILTVKGYLQLGNIGFRIRLVQLTRIVL